jgi:hypothetical protein
MLHHPKFEAARALLLNPPTIPDDDVIRMRAGVSALALLAGEAAALLIDMLDDLEPDPDLEPFLGDPVHHHFYRGFDPEDACTVEDHPPAGVLGDPDELESTLGWTDGVNQTARHWAGPTGMVDELEDEFDGREDGHDAEDDKSDSEWSLGWTNATNQGFCQGLDGDREGPDDDLEPDVDGEWVSDVCDPRDPIDQRELERQMGLAAEATALGNPCGQRSREPLVYIGELRGDGFVPFGPVIPV